MNSVVIYGSRHGNTAEIAYTIAAVLRRHGHVQVLAAEETTPAKLSDSDLVVVGGPTEGHRLTQPLVQVFDSLDADVLKDKLAAAFDTRLRWPRWLSGSAAGDIQERLRMAGAREVMPPESFLVVGNPPTLVPGELDRAVEWAQALAILARDRAPTLALV